MPHLLNLASPRQRAISRRALLMVTLALVALVACQLLPAIPWSGHPGADGAKASGAPPEAATRPNPSTEPLRGGEDVAGRV